MQIAPGEADFDREVEQVQDNIASFTAVPSS